MSLTRDLIRLIRAKPVGRRDLEQAALLVLDTAANFIAGAVSDPGRRLLGWARSEGFVGDGGLRGDAGRNAFLLGALSHILEVDDLHRRSVVHPGCAVVPVLWGIAIPASGPIAGDRALAACLHGYEAAARLGRSVGPAHYRIWHNTATCGPFGSAMAAAHLLGLDEEGCVDALGNAGTQAAGLWQFIETGAMSKHLHAGRAAEAGTVAAGLAAHGVTGAPDILEGARGFFAAMCPDALPELLLADLESPWELHATSLKPWPSCRHTHPAIDAALGLHAKLTAMGLGAEAIEEIRVGAYPAALDLCGRGDPQTAYAAKFSLQHCVAAALADGEVWFEAFEAPARAALAPLRARVRLAPDPALEATYPEAWGAALEVRLSGGRSLAARRDNAKGDPELPFSAAETVAKAARLMTFGGCGDPRPFIDGVLAMADGAPLPPLPRAFPGDLAARTKAAE